MSPAAPRILIALCFALVAVPGATRTAQAETASERAAKRHYDRGQKLFALQKFDDALEQFQKAFDADPIPDFLFNIAQCQRNLGDYEAAIFSFKRFLKLDPEAENREKVEALIAELEEKLAEGNTERLGLGKRQQARGEDENETAASAPVYKKWWFWTGIAVVSVGASVGIYAATRSGDGAPETDFGPFGFDK
ncbi:MAG: tetratricopeptide repeat protein [Deltaproteobacteria bacterium]|nr:tetratricopeptide repeat protein [Deltaproteobacteria bacterium]